MWTFCGKLITYIKTLYHAYYFMFVLTSLHSKYILYNIHLSTGNENRKRKYTIRGKGKCRSMSNNLTFSVTPDNGKWTWRWNYFCNLYTQFYFLTLLGSNGGWLTDVRSSHYINIFIAFASPRNRGPMICRLISFSQNWNNK